MKVKYLKRMLSELDDEDDVQPFHEGQLDVFRHEPPESDPPQMIICIGRVEFKGRKYAENRLLVDR